MSSKLPASQGSDMMSWTWRRVWAEWTKNRSTIANTLCMWINLSYSYDSRHRHSVGVCIGICGYLVTCSRSNFYGCRQIWRLWALCFYPWRFLRESMEWTSRKELSEYAGYVWYEDHVVTASVLCMSVSVTRITCWITNTGLRCFGACVGLCVSWIYTSSPNRDWWLGGTMKAFSGTP